MTSVLVNLSQGDVREHYIHSLVQLIPAGILFWDHVITLDQEISYIWMRPKSRSSIIFLAVRYLFLMSNIPVWVLTFYLLDPENCKVVNFYFQMLLFVSQFVICTLMTLRIYAFYCSDRRILWFFGAAVVLAAGLAGYTFSGQVKIPYPVPTVCHIGLSHQTSFRIAGIWWALFVYDTIIFVLTVARTYRFWREGNIQLRRLNLFSLLFRDGAIYFAVMVLANLANILTFYLCGPFMRAGLSTFVSCISATMLFRLMLNLHSTADTGLYTRPDTTLTWRTRIANATGDSNEEEYPY